MTETDFNRLKEISRGHGSFALWKLDDIDDLTIIKDNIDSLHGRFIFVGGNPSGSIPEFLRNFHKKHQGGRDSWLAKSIGLNPMFRGAYMTDFDKSDFSGKETDVDTSPKKILENSIILSGEVKGLEHYNPRIVAFGHKAFNQLKEIGFKVEYLPHYSARSRITWEEFIGAVNDLAKKSNRD